MKFLCQMYSTSQMQCTLILDRSCVASCISTTILIFCLCRYPTMKVKSKHLNCCETKPLTVINGLKIFFSGREMVRLFQTSFLLCLSQNIVAPPPPPPASEICKKDNRKNNRKNVVLLKIMVDCLLPPPENFLPDSQASCVSKIIQH